MVDLDVIADGNLKRQKAGVAVNANGSLYMGHPLRRCACILAPRRLLTVLTYELSVEFFNFCHELFRKKVGFNARVAQTLLALSRNSGIGI